MVTNDCIYLPRKSGGRCAYGSTMVILWGTPLRYRPETLLSEPDYKEEKREVEKLVDGDLVRW